MSTFKVVANTDYDSFCLQVQDAVREGWQIKGDEMLAETGYHAFFTMLTEQDLLPGCREGIRLLKQDESRHIAYGIHLLSRLINADPSLWTVLEETVNDLFLSALGIISDALALYDPIPFNLSEAMFLNYASAQFEKRLERLEKARDDMNQP